MKTLNVTLTIITLILSASLLTLIIINIANGGIVDTGSFTF
jgi:hypothetical protein